MSLAVFGLCHRTAPIEVRERFAFTPAAGRALLEYLVRSGTAAEAVLLTTCNRTELYLYMPGPRCLSVLLRLLGRHAGLSAAEASDYLVRRYGLEAVEHLLRVSAGLESLVLGEAQIQGQVRAALDSAAGGADGIRAVGPVLGRLFQTALHAGGRVRNETGLGTGAASVASVAVDLAESAFGSLRGRRVLVIGAGEMARLAAGRLVRTGLGALLVANRSAGPAREIARKVGGTVLGLDELDRALPEVDVVIGATSAPVPVLTCERVRAARQGANHPLVIVDLAVPRDVEPAVAGLPDVHLFTADDLRPRVEHTLEQRRAEVPAAERIVREGAAEFWQWFSAREVVPVIRGMREQAEAVRALETERTLNRLRHLAPTDREAVEALTRRLLNKFLHLPTVRLREAGADADSLSLIEAARFLFDLDVDEPPTATEPALIPAEHGDVLASHPF